jgi:hypothetical protein
MLVMAHRSPIALAGVFVLVLACRAPESEVADTSSPIPAPTPADTTPAPTPILTESGDVTTLEHRGRSFRVSRTAVQGYLGHLVSRGDSVLAGGWAADTIALEPADSVLVVLGGQLFRVVPLGVERPDLEDRFENPALRRAGFSFTAPANRIDEVRAFAFRADSVTELGRTSGFVLPAPDSRPPDSIPSDSLPEDSPPQP